MKVEFLEVLCEERSAEIALRVLLERVLRDSRIGFEVYPFRGKTDLLKKLPERLNGYAKWLPQTHKILILVDRDRDDCKVLKKRLEGIVEASGLVVHSVQGARPGQVLPRIVIEELEAWFFGDIEAIRVAYPRLPASLSNRARFRRPDKIANAWESLERTLRSNGYFRGGYRKREAARAIAKHMDPTRNRSKSFQVFRDGVLDLAR